jgi:hypothetical protein
MNLSRSSMLPSHPTIHQPAQNQFALPEPVAETRSIAQLLDAIAANNNPNYGCALKPSATYFKGSLFHGGRALQSNNKACTLMLADSTADYLVQVASSVP